MGQACAFASGPPPPPLPNQALPGGIYMVVRSCGARPRPVTKHRRRAALGQQRATRRGMSLVTGLEPQDLHQSGWVRPTPSFSTQQLAPHSSTLRL